ncbi:MAG: hypothetical protein SF052_01150 [Bacteroidia bacterium]|nr:hypothetical protein [Bacteroidia bacterium]
MAYSKFTSIVRFCQQYGLRSETVNKLFKETEIVPVNPSQRLSDDIAEAQTLPLYTEKAKSELLITPILRDIRRRHPQITFFSGFALNIEGELDLNGNPDFILSAKPNIVEIEAPIFCLMESKNKAIDEGFAQCAAEMYASRLFNRQMGESIETIFGAVTNGFEWVFLKLENQVIHIDRDRYFISELPLLLGIFEIIVGMYVHTERMKG